MASRRAESSVSRTTGSIAGQIREGDLVTAVSDRARGVGKVIAKGPTCQVGYLRSISDEDEDRVEIRLSELRRAVPPANTRCFWRRHGEWRSGRVAWPLDDGYRVR